MTSASKSEIIFNQTMKKFLLITAISVLTFGLASAQDKVTTKPEKIQQDKSPEERAAQRAGVLKKQLNLSDEQTRQVQQLILERDRKHVAEREKIKTNQEEFLSGIDKILNEEQRKKFNEIQEQRKERAKQHRTQGQKPRVATPPADTKQ